MARRITLTVLAIVVVLLGVTAVPLGLLSSAQSRREFRYSTLVSASAVANVAEERLDDSASGHALDRTISDLARAGDQVAVYDAAGRRIDATSPAPAFPPGLLASLSPGQRQLSRPAPDDRLLVLTSVVPDVGTRALGTVALSRSTEPLGHRIAVMWTLVAGVTALGLLIAAIITTGLARWVSRPLSVLEDTAERLGEGELDARSPASSGPREVRRLAANFNTMAARLQTLLDGHQAMMADVSHQLRTPLAALRLRLDLLAQDADPATSEELAGAQQEISRLSRMVSGLLAVARAENIARPPAPQQLDSLIQDRLAAWQPAAHERQVTIAGGDIAPVMVLAGEGDVEQILDNVLANAIEVLPPGGQVEISAAQQQDSATLRVSDNGPGMTRQQQQTAFRRFATGRPGGSGLRLAVVDRLATSSGGSARLSDTPGGGLTVTITLPLAASRGRAGRRAAADGSGQNSRGQESRRGHHRRGEQ
ncbi:MAG TPA: HAMP domain-containing sensor histidine kinase [Streptosporangiaceae bacterium]|jgi:signal transduction histidine kinase